MKPAEQAAWMRDLVALTSEQTAALKKVYDKAWAIRETWGDNAKLSRDARQASYEEWRSVIETGVKEVLTPEQYSRYMEDTERRRRIGRGLDPGVEGNGTKPIRVASDGEVAAAKFHPADKALLESYLSNSLSPSQLTFSRLRLKVTGRFQFPYVPAQGLDKVYARIAIELGNSKTGEKLMVVKGHPIVCGRVGTEEITPRGPRSNQNHFIQIYEFDTAEDILPPEERSVFDSDFLHKFDYLAVTIARSMFIPIGGTEGGLDLAHYDRGLDKLYWDQWPNPDGQKLGSIVLDGYSATGDLKALPLIDRARSPSTWSLFVRDPTRSPESGDPVLVADPKQVPKLVLYCDYLMASPNYKMAANPKLIRAP